jgi:hypothetical protein
MSTPTTQTPPTATQPPAQEKGTFAKIWEYVSSMASSAWSGITGLFSGKSDGTQQQQQTPAAPSGTYTANLMSRGMTPAPSKDISRVLADRQSNVTKEDLLNAADGSTAVYKPLNSPEFQKWAAEKQQQGFEVTPIYEKGNTSGLALAVTVSKGNEHSVFVRGSKEMTDFITDAKLNPVPMTRVDAPGKVANGFDEHSQKVAGAVRWQIDHKAPGAKVTVAGHSLGGAVAGLVGYELKKTAPNADIKVVTFGAPRFGDETFSKDYDRLLGKSTAHFVNDRDPFSRSTGLLYAPTGDTFVIADKGVYAVPPQMMNGQNPIVAFLDTAWNGARQTHRMTTVYNTKINAINTDHNNMVTQAQNTVNGISVTPTQGQGVSSGNVPMGRTGGSGIEFR